MSDMTPDERNTAADTAIAYGAFLQAFCAWSKARIEEPDYPGFLILQAALREAWHALPMADINRIDGWLIYWLDDQMAYDFGETVGEPTGL